MIQREITPVLLDLFGRYPFLTVTGPCQSGKTVLCRAAFPHLAYANLEAPNERESPCQTLWGSWHGSAMVRFSTSSSVRRTCSRTCR